MMDELTDIIDAILESFSGKWPPNITDLVFLAIESNPNYLSRYNSVASGRHKSINSQIGKYVKTYTGMKSVITANMAQSKLIKTYTQLS